MKRMPVQNLQMACHARGRRPDLVLRFKIDALGLETAMIDTCIDIQFGQALIDVAFPGFAPVGTRAACRAFRSRATVSRHLTPSHADQVSRPCERTTKFILVRCRTLMIATMRHSAIGVFRRILGLLTPSGRLAILWLRGAQMTSQQMGHDHDRSATRPHLAAQHLPRSHRPQPRDALSKGPGRNLSAADPYRHTLRGLAGIRRQ